MSRRPSRKAQCSVAPPSNQDVPGPDSGTEQAHDGDASSQHRICRRVAAKTVDPGNDITSPPSPTSKAPRRTSRKCKGKETSVGHPVEGDRLSYSSGETISLGHKPPTTLLPRPRPSDVHPCTRCPLPLQVMSRLLLGPLHHRHILRTSPYSRFKV